MSSDFTPSNFFSFHFSLCKCRMLIFKTKVKYVHNVVRKLFNKALIKISFKFVNEGIWFLKLSMTCNSKCFVNFSVTVI